MTRKILQLRVEFGIMPVRANHPGFEIIDHHRRRHSAKRAKRIFQRPDESLRVLPPHRLTVAFTRATQHTPKQMRPAPLALRFEHPRPLAEIDLQLRARFTFHASNGNSAPSGRSRCTKRRTE